VFVGVDYHQDSVQVCVVDGEGRMLSDRSVLNKLTAIEQAATRHRVPRRMAIEACCGAADLAERLAVERNLPVQLAHPGYVNRLKRAVEDDPIVAQLLSLPGVGLVTAVTLRAEVGRFDRFETGKQLARFCGVTPRNASSGARQADAGLVRAGNPELRAVLVELAHRLIRGLDPRWAQLAAGMLRRGKPKNVVIAAVANRWVRWLHHELRRETLTSTPARQKGLPGGCC
jgi:transposase